MMRGPVWGGPQAAGKRHSQPFCRKRLPHPRGVCPPTKPVRKKVLFFGNLPKHSLLAVNHHHHHL